jgi:CheY-like chemotaxis protein
MSKPLALIVEDNVDLAAILASALQMSGFEVETIHDGARALARLAEIVPALVILDLHLPHLSGANALRQIQTDRRLLNTRVVIATADAAMADELRDKADLVLLKPVSITQIRELAARLIPSAHAAQAQKPPMDTPQPPGDTGNVKPGTGDVKSDTGNVKPGTGDVKPGTGNVKPGMGDVKSDTGNVKPGTGDVKSDAGDVKPGTGDVTRNTGDVKPDAGDVTPDSRTQ